MKKFLLFVILVTSVVYVKSQTIDEIRKLVILSQYDKAREAVDKYLVEPKNAAKPDGWYYKAVIYNGQSRKPTATTAEITKLNDEAYTAMKKYRELDPKLELTIAEQNSTLYNIYSGFYDAGIKNYNDKNTEQSYDDFLKTKQVHDYVFENKLEGPNGLKFSAHDTDIVWNLVVLGNELKRTDDVMTYYKMIGDADLGGDRYGEAYEALIKKYRREKNTEMFNLYLERAKKHYPTDPFWESMGITYAVEGLEGEALYNKYEELTKQYPNSYMVFFNYGYELVNHIYSEDAKKKDVSAYKKLIPELFEKAVSLNNTTEGNLLLANFYYNTSFDKIEDAQKVKGTKPEDLKKKAEFMEQSKAVLKKAIPPGEAAVKIYEDMKEYKISDKVNYKQVLDILIYAYRKDGNEAKAVAYEKRKAEIDKM